MRTGGWMWAALAVVVGVCMYLVKYKVQALEDELQDNRAQIARDRGAIRVLEAEWTYLNDPGRLRRLSAQHLGLRPAVPQNVTDIDALPMRPDGGSAAAQVPNDAKGAPLTENSTHAANEGNKGPFATPRPYGLPVLAARLQRLLFPEAVGATTQREKTR